MNSPENNDKLGEKVLYQTADIYHMGRNQVSAGVSVCCQCVTPVVNVLWKPLIIGKRSSSVIR